MYMNLTDKLSNGYKSTLKILWIIILPIFIDLSNYFSSLYILKEEYHGMNTLFTIKFCIISAPPSINYILENFPSIFYRYSINSRSYGVITQITLLNFFIMLSIICVFSFLRSAYMTCIEKANTHKINLVQFLILGNKNWFSYFVLTLIDNIPIFLILLDICNIGFFIIFTIIFSFLYYVQYSIVVDTHLSLKDNFIRGILILTNNMYLTIKMVLFYGLILSISSIIIFPLSRSGTFGIILSIIIISVLGLGVNKAVIEVYRELSSKHTKSLDEKHIDTFV